MNNIIHFLKLYEKVKKAEKEMRELKEQYDAAYQKVIDDMGRNGQRKIETKDYKVSLMIRKSLEVEDMEKTWMHVFNKYPDKLRLDRKEIENLLRGGKAIPGAKLVEGFYLMVNNK